MKNLDLTYVPLSISYLPRSALFLFSSVLYYLRELMKECENNSFIFWYNTIFKRKIAFKIDAVLLLYLIWKNKRVLALPNPVFE